MSNNGHTEDDLEGHYDGDQVMRPLFRVADDSYGAVACRSLYIQTFAPRSGQPGTWGSRPSDRWHLLATILPEKIVMQPVHTMPHAQRYLSQRHGRIATVIYEDAAAHDLPESADAAVSAIEMRLPWRIFNECTFGLGLIKELDPLWQGLAAIREVDTLVVSNSGAPEIRDSVWCV